MSVEIRPIELPRDAARFVKSWWPIYDDDAMWVPPLIFERKEFLHPKKNPYFKHADVQLFMAHRDGEPVGTISAQVDRGYQKIEEGVGFFGFFEFIDDTEVARALLEAACNWLRQRGMKQVQGPFNFNTNHEFGLLVDGFDTMPCIANPHNRNYYARIYEELGLTKTVDWYAYWMDKGPLPERIGRISERFMSRHPEITLRRVDMKNFDKETAIFHEIYNDAWEDNWGHVHLSDEEFYALANGFKQIANPDLMWFAYVGDDPAALAVTLPDYNQVAKKMNGRLLPTGWFHFLRAKSTIKQLRVFILGVKKKYQKMPLGAPLYVKTWEEGLKLDITGAEASLILETNHRMRGALVKLGARIYKTYRIYGQSLTDEAT